MALTFIQRCKDAYNSGHIVEAVVTLVTIGIFNNRNVARTPEQVKFNSFLKQKPPITTAKLEDRIVEFIQQEAIPADETGSFVYNERNIRKFDTEATLNKVRIARKNNYNASLLNKVDGTITRQGFKNYCTLIMKKDNIQKDLDKLTSFFSKTDTTFIREQEEDFNKLTKQITDIEKKHPFVTRLNDEDKNFILESLDEL